MKSYPIMCQALGCAFVCVATIGFPKNNWATDVIELPAAIPQAWIDHNSFADFSVRDLEAFCTTIEATPTAQRSLLIKLMPGIPWSEKSDRKLLWVDRLVTQLTEQVSVSTADLSHDGDTFARTVLAVAVDAEVPPTVRLACGLAAYDRLSTEASILLAVALSNSLIERDWEVAGDETTLSGLAFLDTLCNRLQSDEKAFPVVAMIRLRQQITLRLKASDVLESSEDRALISRLLEESTSTLLPDYFQVPVGTNQASIAFTIKMPNASELEDDFFDRLDNQRRLVLTEKQFFDGFRSGELGSFARSEWRRFLFSLMGLATHYLDQASDVSVKEASLWQRLFLQAFSSDNLALSGRAAIAYRDFYRMLQAAHPGIELPELDEDLYAEVIYLVTSCNQYFLGAPVREFDQVSVRIRERVSVHFLTSDSGESRAVGVGK